MGKSNKKGPKANVFKVAGAKSLKKSKAKTVNLGLKNAETGTTAHRHIPIKYYHEPSTRRPYIDYTKSQLEACLAAVRAKELTQRDASHYYKIPCSTIKYKLANKSNRNPGRQPTFTAQEEALFVEHISTLSKYGFSFTNLYMRMVIRDYLNSRKRKVHLFRNNIPGKDWLITFLERHKKSLYRPYVNNRAHVSETTITDFIEHVRSETENIHPANIFGYDEISFSDDALKSTIVWRRNTKYPEINSNAVEAGFTVMFCGNAEGEAIPPFIISKSEYHCFSWAENGPDGAYYNNTKHGWIDVITFEKWFFKHLLPILKKRKGPKVLIGDNLCSHISINVLSECKKNDIRFIGLPPNAINILHPLDSAYYQPLQQIWREVLLTWKIVKVESKTATTLKADFPCLLKSALDLLTDLKHNLIQGFEETGIYPLDIQEPLTRLNKIRIVDARKRKLEKREYFSEQIGCASDLAEERSYSWQFEAHKSKNSLYLEDDNANSSLSDSDMEASAEASNDVCLVVVDNDDIVLIQFQHSNSTKNPLKVMMGDHVIVSRGSFNYPGKVLCTGEVGAFVHCMKRKSFLWRWSSITDTRFFEWEKILCKINAPKAVKKGYFSVPELV